jgi:hypothetical protein
VRFKILTAVTVKSATAWDVTPCAFQTDGNWEEPKKSGRELRKEDKLGYKWELE